MKIAIVSDSHYKLDYLADCINLLKEEGCEYLIHAGDFCTKEALDILENSNLKTIKVFGNNDYSLLHLTEKYNINQEPYYFKIKDISFKLMHLPYHLNPDTDIVIFGHTHKFHSEYINKTLFVNPGEVCAREIPVISCVKLEINENEYIITRFHRKTYENNFKKEEYKYVK